MGPVIVPPVAAGVTPAPPPRAISPASVAGWRPAV